MQPKNNQRRGRPEREKPEEKEFEEQVVSVDRVARVVKGGRRFRFRVLVVIGDKKGRIGIGLSKGADVTTAVTKAVEDAKKHVITIKLYKHTIPHSVEAKVSVAHIIIKPASAGTGIIAGGVVRTVLELAGVKNALSKSLNSSNKVNTAYATQKALMMLVPANKWVTNIPLKDVDKKVSSKVSEVSVTKDKPKKIPKKQVEIKTAAKVSASITKKDVKKK
ncbi:MAG: 30S ribosomal protein S5 [Candidatus Saccharibacteria bacterium]